MLAGNSKSRTLKKLEISGYLKWERRKNAAAIDYLLSKWACDGHIVIAGRETREFLKRIRKLDLFLLFRLEFFVFYQEKCELHYYVFCFLLNLSRKIEHYIHSLTCKCMNKHRLIELTWDLRTTRRLIKWFEIHSKHVKITTINSITKYTKFWVWQK